MKQSLYIFKNPITNFYKVGISVNPSNRLNNLSNISGIKLIKMYESVKISNAQKAETAVHRRLKDYRVIGEWFNCDEKTINQCVNKVLSYPRFKKNIDKEIEDKEQNKSIPIKSIKDISKRLGDTNWFKINF